MVKERYCVRLIGVDSLGTEALRADGSRNGIVVGWFALELALEFFVSGRILRGGYRLGSGL